MFFNKKADYKTLQQAAETRRSVYALNRSLPLPAAEVSAIIEHAVRHTPSAFNSQSTRLLVLFGAEHEKLWGIAENALRAVVPAENFAPTAEKLAGFRAAAGTILFYEDQSVIEGLQAQFPAYADNFPVWADHADAMHQYAIWTTLAAAGIGANLQHYNPLIDAEVAKTWDIPAHWHLRAELVFGGIAAPAGEKKYEDIAPRLRVHGL
ncbi:nitroreductase family protein [uncultured Cardiobacterium sp.]|uniref:nitroreductase family protein n=1 Tax=uncultured Cardiobacterium sp. TaxID=417619 RepID=UPI0026068FF8|nr:nitroreductase family protein [uncultured Cardiobacterium sp.]